jgi:uncharacterized protein (DUF849 family)
VSRVKACLNGAREPSTHPALPITAAQLAEAARAARDAGAFAVHLHPRAADGSETLDAGPCGEAVAAIRTACPGLPVGLSTGAWIERDQVRRLQLIQRWEPRPDFVSVNLSEVGAAELVRALREIGIGVEAGIGTVPDARLFLDQQLGRHCVRVLVEPSGRQGVEAAVATSEAIDEVLDAAGVTLQRVHHSFEQATWAVIEAALLRGHDVRAGLEDALRLPDGRLARDNADLVAAAMALANP